MQNLPTELTIRGRSFSNKELNQIQTLTQEHFFQGRTFISKVICETLEWRQPNGWLKDRACRDVLRTLEKLGLINLPESKILRKVGLQEKISSKKDVKALKPLSTNLVTSFPQSVCLKLAKGNSEEKLWNYFVDTYHYLGHKVVVGRCLKYLVEADSIILGAISFSSSAWHLAPRNALLSQFIDKIHIRDAVINNSRFLVLPHVQVPNLASHILSIAVRQVYHDWHNYYSIEPLIIETFVEPNRFHGTCYKAANWIQIGTTKGFKKSGASYQYQQSPKQIFIYPLRKGLRKQIEGAIKHTK